MSNETTEIKPMDPEFDELTNYYAARRALAAAKSVDEVKAIRNKARQMQAYAAIARDHQLVANADEIVKRAERLLGQKMEEEKGQRASPGRPQKRFLESPLPTLSDSGIDKNLADRARKAAAIGDTEFGALLSERRNQILAKAAKPVSVPRPRKKAIHPKVKANRTYTSASADLATLFSVTGLDEQRIALKHAGLTDRKLLTIAPGGDDHSGCIDYELVEVLKGQMGIDELLIAAESYDSLTFKWLAEGFIQLMFEQLGEAKALELIEANLAKLTY